MEQEFQYFFTATILNWELILTEDKYKKIIIDSLAHLVKKKLIIVNAFVIMPNHIHLLWRICSPGHPDKIQQSFMKFTAQIILEDLKRNKNPILDKLQVNASDRQYQVWERNPLPVKMYDDEIMFQKMKYIHYNPCQEKWKLAVKPEDYLFSSAAFYYHHDKTWNFLTHVKE